MFTLIMTLVKGDFNNGVVIRPNVFKSLLVKEIIYLPLLEDCYSISPRADDEFGEGILGNQKFKKCTI
jgi:hypothetical protein